MEDPSSFDTLLNLFKSHLVAQTLQRIEDVSWWNEERRRLFTEKAAYRGILRTQ